MWWLDYSLLIPSIDQTIVWLFGKIIVLVKIVLPLHFSSLPCSLRLGLPIGGLCWKGFQGVGGKTDMREVWAFTRFLLFGSWYITYITSKIQDGLSLH